MDLWNFLDKEFCLSDASMLQVLKDESKTKFIPKGTILVEEGALQTHLPFLIEGVFRGFIIDKEGGEITDCFAHRYGDALMGCHELGESSNISIEAETDGIVLLIPVRTLREYMNDQPTLFKKYNRVLMEALKRHWEEKILMHRCCAMQRYQWFLKTYPGLIDTLNNKHIASFLGMTPVTLSRLRRQLREELCALESQSNES